MIDKDGNKITPETLSAHWEEEHHNRITAGMHSDFDICAGQLREVLTSSGVSEDNIKRFEWKYKK